MTYAYRSVNTVGGAFVAYLPFEGVRFTRILNGAGAFSARLRLPSLRSVRIFDGYNGVYQDGYGTTVDQGRALASAYVTATDPLKRCIYVERDGVVVDAYVIWTRGYDHDEQTVEVSGVQIWSLLRARRIRWHATFAAVDQLSIVDSLITTAQASTGGNLGITVEGGSSGRLRDRTYVANEDKPLGEAIEQLAAVIDGFDFRLDVDRSGDTYTRTLRLFYPRVGRPASETGHVWTLGANMTTLVWPEDGQHAANSIAALGAGEGTTMLRSIVSDTAALAEGFPLMEDSLSLKDVSVASTLTGHAESQLSLRRLPTVLPKATVLANQDPILTAYIPGDHARLVVRPNSDPRWPDGLDVFARIIAIDASPPDDGEPETVALTFDEA